MSYPKIVFALSLAGVIFSGYLSAIKLFTTNCAFNEPCPYFLGYPACWFGFGLFALLFVASLLAVTKTASSKGVAVFNSIVALAGTIFALYFTIPEILLLLSGAGGLYSLGLPTCAYGLIFFILILVLSLLRTLKS